VAHNPVAEHDGGAGSGGASPDPAKAGATCTGLPLLVKLFLFDIRLF
jgi:hypothetical protein